MTVTLSAVYGSPDQIKVVGWITLSRGAFDFFVMPKAWIVFSGSWDDRQSYKTPRMGRGLDCAASHSRTCDDPTSFNIVIIFHKVTG